MKLKPERRVALSLTTLGSEVVFEEAGEEKALWIYRRMKQILITPEIEAMAEEYANNLFTDKRASFVQPI